MNPEPSEDAVDEPAAPAEGPVQRAIPWLVGVLAMIGCAWLAQLYLVTRAENRLLTSQQALADLELRSVRHQQEAERLIAHRQLDLVKEAAQRALDPARWQVAVLQSATPGVTGIAVWNPLDQAVLFYGQGLPAPAAGTAYALWVSDPVQPQPIFAGFIEPAAAGAQRLVFHAKTELGQLLQFSVTCEARAPAPPPAIPQGPSLLRGS